MVNLPGVRGSQPRRVDAAGNRAYVVDGCGEIAMPAIAAPARLSRPLVLLAVIGGALMAVTLALWTYYGTTVFFEIVRTGWLACF
jgi:hypothetical protein